MKYRPNSLSRGEGVYPLHDTTVFDPGLMKRENLSNSRRLGRKTLKNSTLLSLLPVATVESIKAVPELTFQWLYNAYQSTCGFGSTIKIEPEWMKHIDYRDKKAIQSMWRRLDGTDPVSIVPNMRYHGIGYIVEDEGLIAEAIQTFGLSRLLGIKQLAYLHDPLTENSVPSVELHFMHSRLLHSYDVSVVGNLVCANNPQLKSLESYLRTAFITHDALTPAGGDSTKLIDPKAFDEDANYQNLLHGRSWEQFSRKYNLKKDVLTSIVNGQGLGGRVLDLADKSAYMARDLDSYLMRGSYNGPREYAEEYEGMRSLIKEDENLCALWKCAEVIGNKLVITDADFLYRFLKLRALLFRGLYYNPRSRKLECIITKKIITWAYQTSKLTREMLLSWTDSKLEELLRELTGFRTTFFSTESDVEEYDSLEEAMAREESLRDDESILVAIDDFAPSTKCGTRSFCVRKGRKILDFADAYPYRAKMVRDMIRIKKRKFLVYIVKMDSLEIYRDQRLRKELKEFNGGSPNTPLQQKPRQPQVRWEQRKGNRPPFIMTGC